MTPDQERRLAAKRSNERVKLFATTLNATALAVFGTAYVLPAINNPSSLRSPGPWLLLLLAILTHLRAHVVFEMLGSEE